MSLYDFGIYAFVASVLVVCVIGLVVRLGAQKKLGLSVALTIIALLIFACRAGAQEFTFRRIKTISVDLLINRDSTNSALLGGSMNLLKDSLVLVVKGGMSFGRFEGQTVGMQSVFLRGHKQVRLEGIRVWGLDKRPNGAFGRLDVLQLDDGFSRWGLTLEATDSTGMGRTALSLGPTYLAEPSIRDVVWLQFRISPVFALRRGSRSVLRFGIGAYI